MSKYRYLIHLQFLGFRYHGWLRQPGVKTVEGMVEKTLDHVLGSVFEIPQVRFRILGSGRTDAKVSAHHYTLMLCINTALDLPLFHRALDQNLPADIRAVAVETAPEGLNVLQSPRLKEYLYLFAFGEKSHPFSAPFMATFTGNLDLELMKEGAVLFEGEHDFVQYCTRPGSQTQTRRRVSECVIVPNHFFTASFFPESSWALKIQAKGFLRYQIRLIMGQLVRLGRHEIEPADIECSLTGKDHSPLRDIVPGSGLILNRVLFDQ